MLLDVCLMRQRQAQETRDFVFGSNPLQKVLMRVACRVGHLNEREGMNVNFSCTYLAIPNFLYLLSFTLSFYVRLNHLAQVRLLVANQNVVR